ncbi:MAG: mannose-1-phosphate guanylyltransferase [Bacteroidales bacterium]|nr:mannose-1-phosphate guanylyltransferase [Bacteroidales bacterium]
MKSNKYCVIMAGGIGSRFWPLSTTNKPKQFLDILNTGRSLLQQTYDRFVKIIPAENILIVTGVEYVEIVHEQLPSIPLENILAEPMRRNTAPCIAYASYKIHKKNAHASIVVAPADHLIIDEDDFLNQISEGLNFATQSNVLLTLGITPDRPATGFGYIQVDSMDETSQYHKVKSFTEKPHLELAKFFVKSGEFYWNSGIFLWSVKSIKHALAEFLPELSNLFEEHSHSLGTNDEKEAINKIYSATKSISIDYGVMEKADNVFIRCTNFGWSDLGTWDSLYNVSEKDENQNVSHGNMIALSDSDNNYVQIPNGKLAVIKDIDNMIIVDSGDKILICNRENEQWVKELVDDANQRFNI